MTSGRTGLAVSMAEQIAAEADGRPPVWTGPDIVGDEQSWRIADGPVDDGLYSGAAGIALSLAAAVGSGATSPVGEVAVAAATQALAGGRDLLADAQTDLASGSSGVAYGAAWVGRLLGRPDLEEEARTLASATLARLRSGADRADLLTGAAGALVAALAIARDDPSVVAAAVDVADWIASRGRPQPWGAAWESAESVGPALLGLSHGTSGIAVALAEAASLPGGGHLWAAVEQALEYERSWFEPVLPGWPDLRSVGPTEIGRQTMDVAGVDRAVNLTGGAGSAEGIGVAAPTYPTAWCHGAIGIGLARLRLLTATDAQQRLPGGSHLLLAEATAAIEAARQRLRLARARLRDGEVEDCCLCHGLAGAVDLLLGAAGLSGGEDHLRAARRSADILVAQHAAARAWPCGLPRPAASATSPPWPAPEPAPEPPPGPGPEPPGLFLGRAGILLTLLRSDRPDAVPAVSLPQRLPPTA